MDQAISRKNKQIKNFALIGAAGFVAPRHMRAIKECGHQLLAACDPYDGVGIIDSFFPSASFFTEFERFDRHVEKLKREGTPIDYFSICSPNYLHDAHIRFSLRYGAHAICEKPLVLNPWNLDALEEIEKETASRIYTVMQLRLHPSILELKEKIKKLKSGERKQISLTYIAPRGNWYYTSWKGELQKSGGVATNIGIHFFDMLMWIFGPCKELEVHQNTHDRASGWLELEGAVVKWFLSIDEGTLPDKVSKAGKQTYRSLTMDGEELDFSAGFEDLHTATYQETLQGRGFTIGDVRPSIELVHRIRNSRESESIKHRHPFSGLPQKPHPFDLNSQ